MTNRLFVGYKPKNISSNGFLGKIKRKYGIKKAGYSGTLDPFACGVLIVAFGQYPKLFRFLKKSPKKYKATLWLGASSETLDIEKVEKVETLETLKEADIVAILSSLKGEVEYLPPRYSAKKINGKQAYKLAREGKDFERKKITSKIYDITLLHYRHPFITFEISISEGGYVRIMAQTIAQRIGANGCLSYLERTQEGDFIYQNEKELNPVDFLDLEENFYLSDENDLLLGRKLNKKEFKTKKNGIYFVNLDKMLTIVEIREDEVKYLINRLELG